MNRVDVIRQMHAAELAGNREESMRLFNLGLVTERIYRQIKREAQTEVNQQQKEEKYGKRNFA